MSKVKTISILTFGLELRHYALLSAFNAFLQ